MSLLFLLGLVLIPVTAFGLEHPNRLNRAQLDPDVESAAACSLSLLLAQAGVSMKDGTELRHLWDLGTRRVGPSFGQDYLSGFGPTAESIAPDSARVIKIEGRQAVASWLARWAEQTDEEYANPTPIQPPFDVDTVVHAGRGFPTVAVFMAGILYAGEYLSPGIWGRGWNSFFQTLDVIFAYQSTRVAFGGKPLSKQHLYSILAGLGILSVPGAILPGMESRPEFFLDLVITASVIPALNLFMDYFRQRSATAGSNEEQNKQPVVPKVSAARILQTEIQGGSTGLYASAGYTSAGRNPVHPEADEFPIMEVFLFGEDETTGEQPVLFLVAPRADIKITVIGPNSEVHTFRR